MRRLVALAVLLLAASVGSAERFYPMIMAIRPVAIQVGKTSECEFESRYDLRGADRVIVEPAGEYLCALLTRLEMI